MAKNFIQDGEHVTVPAPAAVTSGAPVVVGALFGVAEHSAASGALVTLARRGAFRLPKTTGQAWTVGQKLYWDAANSLVTSTVGSNLLIGIALEVVIAAGTAGVVLLDGTIR